MPSVAHRNATASSNIVVKLVRRFAKYALIRAGKNKQLQLSSIGMSSSQRIYVSEHLTPRNADLYYKARCIRRQRQIKYLWTRSGKIYAKVKDGDATICIHSEEGLRTLENGSNPKPRK